MKVFDKTLATLERALDARLLRQNALAGNIANANTPGYTPKDIDFEAAMASAPREPAAPGASGSTSVLTEPGSAAGLGTSASEPLPLDAPRPALQSLGPGDTSASPLVGAAGASPGLDGNAVDLDRAMVALAQNALQYTAAARAAGKKLAILRYVASDGTG